MVDDLPDVEVLDVFAVDDRGDVVSIESLSPRANLPSIDVVAIGDAISQQMRDYRATPGARLGLSRTPLVRQGNAEEICQPVLVSPIAARQIFLSGVLFEADAAIEVDVASRQIHGDAISWRASVRVGPDRRRDAELWVHPSTSANVTVMELIPSRPRRFRTKEFVDAGVAAIDGLGRSLSRVARVLADSGGGLQPA